MLTTPEPDWPEALATVTSCTYDMRVGRALAFGLPSGKHFRIAYNYWANDELHTGEYFSATAVPQGSLFPVHYHPERPHENTHGSTRFSKRGSLLTVGLVGSLLLSLAWFALLRGCR